ncbi:pilus assembly protein [Aestuariimicrobium sp. p3-SID1156]|uniref:TadE family protein n=1 Tax=Aestuariimicrobium sp. p3-SID1156 TaxID=2916038 RepID=UPI00223A7628|nr:TadE family protein [Aestuariimicrobium sp. p3-SID1156]MCT1459829.1 pilus assembly protein [Aestuariimicrobium sp. p3-SID1156]
MTPARPSRGLSTAVEATLVLPAVVIILSLMVAGFRVWQTRTDLHQVAGAAARAGSLARSASSAEQQIRQVVQANRSACPHPQISSELSGFTIPAGQPASITVTLTCHIPLGDLIVPGLPGHRTITVTASAPLDTYRERRR